MTTTTSPNTPSNRPAANSAPPKKGFAALQSRNFRLLWFGMVISNVGNWMAITAEGWLVTDLEPTRAPVVIGMISVAFAVPMLTLPPFGGAMADRFNRVRMLWVVQIGYFILSSLIAVAMVTGIIQVWMLIAYSFGLGVVLALDSPVRNAMLPDMVEKHQLSGAISLNSAAYSGAALIGPAIAGLLIPISFIGIEGLYVFNAISCLPILLSLHLMRDLPAHREHASARGPVLGAIAAGFRYARSSRVILGVLMMSVISGIFARSYSPLLAVFARDVFGIDAALFGLMLAAPGLGTLVGAFGIAGRRDIQARGKAAWGFVSLFAAMLFLFAVTPWYPLAVAFLIVAGLALTVSTSQLATIVQLTTPNEYRGRVMSIFMLTVIGVPSLGTFLSGWIANRVGVQPTVAGGAALVLVLAALLFWRNAALREA